MNINPNPIGGPQGYRSFFKTDYAGMSVKFSPFDATRLAVTCSANFGIVGKGRVYVMGLLPNGQMEPQAVFDEPDAVFDCSWSENMASFLLAACGDGSVKLFDVDKRSVLFNQKDHRGEVYSVESSHKLPNLFLSSGFDGSIKLWDLNFNKLSLSLQAGKGCVYQATWHPINDHLFGSVNAEGLLQLWDLNLPNKNVVSFRAHDLEILACDFNKYQEHILTASIDKTIKIWDLRNLKVPINVLAGHRYPVRKAKFSPHQANIIVSGSYDMNVNVWDLNDMIKPLSINHREHTEFVVSVDFNLFNERQIATTSWDGRVLVWNWNEPQPKC